jgi:uncharacterized protein
MKDSNEWVEVRNSSIHNNGVFALKDIPNGTRIIEYLGRKITNKEADEISEKEMEEGAVYLFGLDSRYTLDGRDYPNNNAKYINHSCDTNSESLNDNGRIWIVATRDIKKDEEITYDYCLETDDPHDHPCLCSSDNCRGLIVPIKIRKKRAK